MGGEGSPSEVDRELISSATSGQDIISALARRGCSDLTGHIDLAACGSLPLAGGGFCDVYQGSTNRGDKIAIKSLRLYDKPGKDNEKVKVLKGVISLVEIETSKYIATDGTCDVPRALVYDIRVDGARKPDGIYQRKHWNGPNWARICSGLSHIHANDMVHGDLKAANVMVSRDGTAMIADFGNSQLKDLTLKFTNTTSSSLSVRWAAPELLDGDDDPQVTKESDVYAYGMTVLVCIRAPDIRPVQLLRASSQETLTGKVPFEEFGERKVLTLVALKHQTPARPAVGVSDAIWDILRRCWTWKQVERPSITIVERLMGDAYTQTRVKGKEPDSTGYNHPLMNDLVNPGPVEIHLEQAQLGKSESPTTVVQQPAPEEGRSGALESMYHLAVAHFEQDRLAEAESLWAKVMAAWKEMLGPDHPNTLQAVHCLLATYVKQGRLAEAEPLGVEVVAARKRVLGVDHPDTLQSAHCLTVTYQGLGRLVEGEALGAEVVAARKRVLGAEHPDTLCSLHSLAFAHEQQGRLAEAESQGLEVVAARRRVLGADHPETLWSEHNLASTYQEQGRLVEAHSLGSEVVATRRRVLGSDHVDTLQSMHNLALVSERQGQFVQAELLGVEVVATRKRVLGTEHPDTLWSMHNLAFTYQRQGRTAEATSLGLEVVTARRRVLGADHPDTLWSEHNLAYIHQEQGRLGEAESLGVKVVAARKRVIGEDHIDTLQSMHNLALVYEKQSRLAEAESLGVKIVAARKRVLGVENLDTLWSMHNLAIVYRRRGYLAQAESLAVEVLAARKRNLGEHHPDTINSMLSIASIYQAQNRHLESQLLLNQANNFKMAAK